MLARGESTGVFQFESSGMREALRLVKPTEFEDLIALVALYRPGPMGYIPTYAARKHGKEQVAFADPRLEAITGGSYAICIYQEQYMEIAKQLGGFSPAEAETLRKAIGKKIHALMASLKDKFLEGCAENDVAAGVAQQLWKDMESSQDYSFNKAHAACYALIAYRTAWLKANHAREYMAALISSVMNTKDRVPFYVNACREMGIDVRPPDVNSSQHDFAIVDGTIHFGLNAVKNVGESAAEAIVRARTEGGAVRVDLGAHRARRPADGQPARARVARQVRRPRLHGRDAAGDARRAGQRARPRLEARGRPSRRAGLDLRRRLRRGRGGARRSTTPRSRRASSTSASCCGWRRRRSACTSPSTRSRRSRASSGARPTARCADVERRRDGEIVVVGGIVAGAQAGDDQARRADGLRDARRPHRKRRGRRLQLDLRRRARPPRGGPHADRQGARRPQAGGRDEARRAGGDRRSSRRRSDARCVCESMRGKRRPGSSASSRSSSRTSRATLPSTSRSRRRSARARSRSARTTA